MQFELFGTSYKGINYSFKQCSIKSFKMLRSRVLTFLVSVFAKKTSSGEFLLSLSRILILQSTSYISEYGLTFFYIYLHFKSCYLKLLMS